MNTRRRRTLHRPAKADDDRLRAELCANFGRRRRPRLTTSPPRSVSHYEFLEEIGAGAKGSVYLAWDRRNHKQVAIKMLSSCSQQESRMRALREGECAAALNHPNIVAVCEVIHHRGMDFIVMEYIPGRTLDREIPKRGLRLEVCLPYALQIAQAVGALHSAKIIHRDLKPANFVITRNGIVKLLDFGLAKVVDRERQRQSGNRDPKLPETREGTILGTAGYMSPEQVRGQRAGPRSDVFSFGAIFYEMLTGRRAFHEDTPIETMSAILHKRPPTLPARIPVPVGKIVRRCLAKDPRRRYKTAKQLLVDLTVAAKLTAV